MGVGVWDWEWKCHPMIITFLGIVDDSSDGEKGIFVVGGV